MQNMASHIWHERGSNHSGERPNDLESALLSFFMSPTMKRLAGHIGLPSFVRSSVRPFLTLFDA